ncbi:MAG: tyrosine-type recombinase/integrase [Alphaproteobacteria bacterium]
MMSIEKRTSKKGVVSYRVKVRRKGYPVQTETFPNLTMAKNWATRMEAKITEGVHLTTIEAKRHTLSELFDAYRRHVISNKKTINRNTAHHIAKWDELIGSYSLAGLTPSIIIRAWEQIAVETGKDGRYRSNATLNRYMAALSVALSYAVKELEWLDINPVTKISKKTESRGRVRYLSDDERNNLLTSAKKLSNPYMYPLILLAITTGARKMEMLGLKWTDVDLNAKRAILHDTKNGEQRTLPLVEPALTELKKLYSQSMNSEYVFPSRNGLQPIDIKRCWTTLLKDAGIQDFRFHDLRHTCASYLAMNGFTMGEIAAVLGHKTLQMTKRYAHLSDAHSQSVVEQMSNKIFGGK